MKIEVSELKKLYRIKDAWRDLGLPGRPGKTCRSPFPGEHRHGDRNPSFSVYEEGLKFKNFATGETGDVFDLVAKVKGLDNPEAIRWVRERTGSPVIQGRQTERNEEPDLLPNPKDFADRAMKKYYPLPDELPEHDILLQFL